MVNLKMNREERTIKRFHEYIDKELSFIRETGMIMWHTSKDSKSKGFSFFNEEGNIDEERIENFFEQVKELGKEAIRRYYEVFKRYPNRKSFNKLLGFILDSLYKHLKENIENG